MVQKVGVTPMSLHNPREPEVVFREAVQEPGAEVRASTQPRARTVYLKASDFVRFGATIGCPRCDHDGTWGPGRTN